VCLVAEREKKAEVEKERKRRLLTYIIEVRIEKEEIKVESYTSLKGEKE